MKKIISTLLALTIVFCVGNFWCERNREVTVADYDASYKDAVMEIAFQDPYQFFSGSYLIKQGLMPAELFESENRKEMEAILQNELHIKKVLLDDKKVIGFITFMKAREQSLESLKAMVEAQGMPFDENQILTFMPGLKRTNAECDMFAKIVSIAVSKDFRGKGYGKVLLQAALSAIKELWPTLKSVQLDTNEHNEIARKLYVSQGFVESSNQPKPFSMMKVVQYEKAI